jgi:5-methylcytosine-specific restriction endonuclease McrA
VSRSRSTIPAKVRRSVLERDGGCKARGLVPGRCHGRAEVHHLRRRSQGRDDSTDNLIAVCSFHHQWITEHPKDAHDLGLAKWSWEE